MTARHHCSVGFLRQAHHACLRFVCSLFGRVAGWEDHRRGRGGTRSPRGRWGLPGHHCGHLLTPRSRCCCLCSFLRRHTLRAAHFLWVCIIRRQGVWHSVGRGEPRCIWHQEGLRSVCRGRSRGCGAGGDGGHGCRRRQAATWGSSGLWWWVEWDPLLICPPSIVGSLDGVSKDVHEECSVCLGGDSEVVLSADRGPLHEAGAETNPPLGARRVLEKFSNFQGEKGLCGRLPGSILQLLDADAVLYLWHMQHEAGPCSVGQNRVRHCRGGGVEGELEAGDDADVCAAAATHLKAIAGDRQNLPALIARDGDGGVRSHQPCVRMPISKHHEPPWLPGRKSKSFLLIIIHPALPELDLVLQGAHALLAVRLPGQVQRRAAVSGGDAGVRLSEEQVGHDLRTLVASPHRAAVVESRHFPIVQDVYVDVI
mmetsp:Transcript_1076/g.2297  ORF Transcript_1076/g.2297 Transcript_1076/m.2297 type:complete len:426 (-) Transcript_1076:456-1733(-)